MLILHVMIIIYVVIMCLFMFIFHLFCHFCDLFTCHVIWNLLCYCTWQLQCLLIFTYLLLYDLLMLNLMVWFSFSYSNPINQSKVTALRCMTHLITLCSDNDTFWNGCLLKLGGLLMSQHVKVKDDKERWVKNCWPSIREVVSCDLLSNMSWLSVPIRLYGAHDWIMACHLLL